MGETHPSENSKIVVIKTKECPVGVICDEVLNIYDVSKKYIETPLSTVSNVISAYIQGVQIYN